MAGETQRRHPDYLVDQRGFFDELITTEWDTYVDPRWDAVRRDEVARLFEIVQPRTVLDVGCGCGFHDQAMADYPYIEEVVGIDYSPASIEVASREYPHPRVRRQVADLTSFDEGPFDLVVSFHVIEHVSDPTGFLAHCRRLSGGHVGVLTPNRDRLENRLRRLARRATVLCDPQHFAEYTAPEIARMADMAPVGSFGHGLHLFVPKLGQLIPPAFGRRLGRRLPSLASVHGVVLG